MNDEEMFGPRRWKPDYELEPEDLEAEIMRFGTGIRVYPRFFIWKLGPRSESIRMKEVISVTRTQGKLEIRLRGKRIIAVGTMFKGDEAKAVERAFQKYMK